jgi:hypothetical protein
MFALCRPFGPLYPVAMLRTLTRPLPKGEERTTDKSGPSDLSPLPVGGRDRVTSRFAFTYHDLLFTIDRPMKRCPQCHRIEVDDALAFCRADGTALVSDSSSIDQDAGTVKLGSGSVANETATGILPQTTDANINRATAPTTVLPAQSAPLPTKRLPRFAPGKPLIAVGALLLIVMGIGGYFFVKGKRERPIESVAVLPFENKSGNADSEYLSDGLAESRIYSLSQI